MAKEKNSKCPLIYFPSSHIPIITSYEGMQNKLIIMEEPSINKYSHEKYLFGGKIFNHVVVHFVAEADQLKFLDDTQRSWFVGSAFISFYLRIWMLIIVKNSSSHSSYILAEVIFVHVYHIHKEPSRLVILFVFLKRTSVVQFTSWLCSFNHF
jgi:hypothetical protein